MGLEKEAQPDKYVQQTEHFHTKMVRGVFEDTEKNFRTAVSIVKRPFESFFNVWDFIFRVVPQGLKCNDNMRGTNWGLTGTTLWKYTVIVEVVTTFKG